MVRLGRSPGEFEQRTEWGAGSTTLSPSSTSGVTWQLVVGARESMEPVGEAR